MAAIITDLRIKVTAALRQVRAPNLQRPDNAASSGACLIEVSLASRGFGRRSIAIGRFDQRAARMLLCVLITLLGRSDRSIKRSLGSENAIV